MTIRFHCPHCSRRYKTKDQHAGREIVCATCGQTISVPLPADESTGQDAGEGVLTGEDEPVRFARPDEDVEEIDMTPMVDVTFLLLIFFMVTAAFSLQKSIDMPTPDSTEAAAETVVEPEEESEDDYIVVKVYADSTIWVEDTQAPSWHELLAKLNEQRRRDQDAGVAPRNKLLVMAAGDASHQAVVRALDAGSAIGMESVRLSELEDDAF